MLHNLIKKIMEAISKKPHRSQQEMFGLIESFKKSGMSQHLFCEQQNLPYSVFQYWLKKFNKRNAQNRGEFIEIKASRPAPFSSEVEIIFPSGAKVLLSPADPVLIRSLVL